MLLRGLSGCFVLISSNEKSLVKVVPLLPPPFVVLPSSFGSQMVAISERTLRASAKPDHLDCRYLDGRGRSRMMGGRLVPLVLLGY